MPDRFNFGQLTKEMIVSRLRDIQDAPAVAAEIAKKTIVAGVKSTQSSAQSPQETVQEICSGTMSGLLLIEKDLPRGAVEILRCLAEAAQELHIDPSELITWAMQGIAKITPFVTPEMRLNICCAIEEAYQGTGEIFTQFCEAESREPR